MTGYTKQLVELGRSYTFEALPSSVIDKAKLCVLDWIGSCLAGSEELATKIARDVAIGDHVGGEVSLIGMGGRAHLRDAILVNGIAGHVLDMDDFVPAMNGHPSAPVLPGLLALGELNGIDGRATLTAFVAAVEVECRLGVAMLPRHYEKGWHSSATIGTFGAAVGGASLMHLAPEQWEYALGLAGAQTGGLQASFGTMGKALQIGHAAEAGVLAARLAAGQFTGAEKVFESWQGVSGTLGGDFELEEECEASASSFYLESIIFKYHASCFLTHASIEGIREIKRQVKICPDDVKRIRVSVPSGHMAVCNVDNPRNRMEAKFSLKFLCAVAVTVDVIDEKCFTDQLLANRQLRSLMSKIDVEEDPAMLNYAALTTLTTVSGSIFDAFVDMESLNGTEVSRVGERDAVQRKFRRIATQVLGSSTTEQVVELVQSIDEVEDIGLLLQLCSVVTLN